MGNAAIVRAVAGTIDMKRNPGADATGLAWTKEFVDRNPQKA